MHLKTWLLLSCAVAGATLGSAAHAQSAAPSNTIEELVVTAEKREQSLQDVPVAVSAFTDERREVVGINSIQDLTNFTPGLSYNTNNDRAFLRGIGRFTNNRSSEGGVAMYTDGLYTSSVTGFALSTLFLDRTEVLRGPQGTLYGKNAIGGAMNAISKRPTDDLYAEVRGLVGNFDRYEAEAAVSGPLFGSVRGRLAGSYSDYGKGVFQNLNPRGEDEGNKGVQWYLEGQLDGKITDRLEWWAKSSTSEWHNVGRGPGGRSTIQYGLRDVTSTNVAALTPNSAFGLSAQLPGNTCQFCFDTDDANFISIEFDVHQLNVTFHADKFDIRYITGLSYYDYRLQTDVDATSRQSPITLTLPARNPATLAVIPGATTNVLLFPRQQNQYQEEVWWFSNELNFASTYEGPVQWLLGLYQFREGSNYSQVDARYPDDPRFESPTTQTGASVAPNPLRRYAFGASMNASESYAAFGQVDWQATEQLKVTAGLRYTYDRKRSEESNRLLCLYTASCPITTLTGRPVDVTDLVAAPASQAQLDPSVVPGSVYTDATTGIRHRSLRNNWDAVTGTLGLDYQPNGDTLIYGKYTRGYKAGGFNAGLTALPQFVTTKEETIDAFEIGAKATLQGNLQLNASVFYYDYSDIQVPITALNPLTNTNVSQFFNFPKARNVGAELEAIWQPITNLQILANYSYLDATLQKACCFADPNDPEGRQPGDRFVNGLKDLSGNALPNSTPHRVSLNANYTWEDVLGGDLVFSANYVWRSSTYYDIFEDYWNRAKAFDTTDARLLYKDGDDRFTVIASVKNIFDTKGQVGSSGSRLTTGPNRGFVNQTLSYVLPRQISLEVQFRY